MAQKYSIQLLYAKASDWNASNYVIPYGELVAEVPDDVVSGSKIQMKIGNGIDIYRDLPYVAERGEDGDSLLWSDLTDEEKAQVSFKFSDLTEAEKESFRFKFSDLTDEEIELVKFRFSELTDEEKDDVRFRYSELTDEEKEEVKIQYSDLTEEERAEMALTYSELTDEEKAELKGEKGDSITVATVSESIEDGGENVVTFSDGSSVAILNGSKGDTGEGLVIIGTYDSYNDLVADITSPSGGEAYGVGTSEPYDIYIYDGIHNKWVNHGQLQGPQGPQGKQGDAFTYEDFTEEQLAELHGTSCTHSWNGTVLTVTSASGESSADLKGASGDPGYTPVRGTDYWTQDDQQAIVDAVVAKFTNVSEVAL